MDMTKSSGISIEKVHLIACQAKMLGVPEKLHFNMTLTGLKRVEKGNTLIVEAGFDMMGGVEKPACALECTFGIVYSRTDESQMTWGKVSDGLVLTHLVPYVREFVSSVTLRMPLPALILQPTNISLLLEEYRLRQAKSSDPGPLGAQLN